MSKPLSQLIQERIETFQETARIHSKYETECRICQTTLNELETIQTALNEVIKEIEEKKGNCLETIGSGMAWSGILDGKMAGFDVSLELLKGKADK